MRIIESRIPPHTSFKLEHNPHRVLGSSGSLSYYVSVNNKNIWINQDQEEKALETSELWVATIYTLSSVHVYQAAELEALLAFMDPNPRGHING